MSGEDTELSKVLPDVGSLILCGEPGLGKSTELEKLVEYLHKSKRPEESLVVTQARAHDSFSDFRDWLSTSAEWTKWSDSGERLTLVVDGVDEGMIRIPLFVAKLAEFLKNKATNRIRLVLCCRSAEWPDAEGRALVALWSESVMPIFELRQLRKEDAKAAAEVRGYDGNDFLKAVFESGVVSLAARPITLLFLLDEFENNRFKAISPRELYENGCRRFFEESNVTRVTLARHQSSNFSTSEDKLFGAKRLACLFLIGGKSTLHCPMGSLDKTPASALRIADALKYQSGLTENVLIEALKTGLFSSHGSNLFVFTHQTFAECLAGQSIAELPIEQLKILLCARDQRGEHVIPQLAELASRVAGYREEFFEFLISIDPGVLLRSDVHLVGKNIKSRLVDRILEMAGKDEFFDESKYNRFWKGLDHPDLPGQIGNVLSNRSASLMARRVAVSIAEECRRPELIGVLRGILDDHGAEEWLRRSAANALCRSMPEDRLAELEPLAKREVGPDPNYSISGFALRRLVPSRWSVAQALPYFKMPSNSGHYGSYHSTLVYHLPQFVKDSDLVQGLKAVRLWKTSFASLGNRRKLSMTILLKGLEKIDDPAVRDELVKLWQVKSRRYRDLFSEGRGERTGLEEASDESRLKWVTAILNDPSSGTDEDAYHIAADTYSLLRPGDLGWVLRQLPNQPKQQIAMWVKVVQILRRNESSLVHHWDLFMETLQVSPELREGFAWLFKITEIDSPEGRSMKARWLIWERRMGRRQRRWLKPDYENQIVSDLTAIREGRVWGFKDLCYPLSVKPGQTRYCKTLSRDISKYPGWENASEDRREEITSAARTFLLKCSDGYSELGSRTNYSDPGLVAICLLREELESSSELQEAVSQKWIDAITGDSRSDSDCGRRLFAIAYRLNPERTIQGWLREMQRDCEQHGHLFALRHAAFCFDSALADAAVSFIETLKDSKSIRSGIRELGDLHSIAAFRLAPRLIERFSVGNGNAEFLDAAIIGGLDIACAAAWEKAYPIMERDEELAMRVLKEICPDLSSDGGKLASNLNEEQLADFYLLLCRSFPKSEDPKIGTGFASRRQSVVHVRSAVMTELASRANEDACEQLLRLAQLLPDDSTWILWRYQSTLEATRRREWHPLSIEQLASIMADGTRRFIRNDDDLMEIVIESLKRLQKHLKGDDLPAVEDLWQWTEAGLKRSNFRHKDEEAVSDYIARWLRDQLGPASSVVVNREVQPKRGKKTDILVQAWSFTESGRNRTERPLSVTIEVKGCWNDEVASGAKDQLLDGYLIPFGRTHGIFLVGWFYSPNHSKIAKGSRSKLKFTDRTSALMNLESFVSLSKHPGVRIEPFLLDARLPAD